MAVLRFISSVISMGSLIMSLMPQASATPTGAGEDVDLKVKLLEPPFNLPQVYDDAMSALDSIQRATLCHQTAAGDLIYSCKALDSSNDQPPCTLDHIKASFSARLALCELVDAHAPIPEDCQKLLHNTTLKTRFTKIFRAKDTSKQGAALKHWEIGSDAQEQTSRCIAALGSRTQWWMSYSNARQNVFAICHASRSDVDREDALAAHRAMTGIASEYGQAMDSTLKMQQEFAKKVDALQKQLLKDAHGVSSYLRHLFNDLEERISSFLSVAKDGTQEVHSELNKMTTSLQNASGEVHEALSYIKDNAVTGLSDDLGSVRHELGMVAQVTADMVEQQLRHRTWIGQITQVFEQISNNHTALQAMQSQQFDDISKIMYALATAIQAHDQGLKTLMAKMDGLGTIIDDKAALMASVDIGNLSSFFLQAMLLAIVLLAASLCGPSVALIVAIMGLCYLFIVANTTAGRLISGCLEVLAQPFLQAWVLLLALALVVLAAAYGAHLFLSGTRRAAAYTVNEEKGTA